MKAQRHPNLKPLTFNQSAFACMRCAQSIHAPALRLAARDQSADADDLVEGVLMKAFAERIADFRFGGVAHVEHPRGRCEVAHRFQVPDNEGLLCHRFNVANRRIRGSGPPLTIFGDLRP